MRLDFNVLWVDDQPDLLDPQIAAITRQMEDQGFEFRARKCRSIDAVRSAIREDVFSDNVDLVLVDWDLGDGLQGQDVLVEIRQAIQYKDVVFYSSLTSVAELRLHAYTAGVEGVFCASKPNIVTEVIGVFEALVKKVLDLDHTRGIVMGATSDIDRIVVECLSEIHRTSPSTTQSEMLEKARELVQQSHKNLLSKSRKLEKTESLVELLEEHSLFTANDRLRVLNTALKDGRFDEHATLRAGLKTYITSVVPRRNDLGHLVLTPAGQPSEFVDLSGKTVTLADMRDLRRLLLGIRADFRRLREMLNDIQ